MTISVSWTNLSKAVVVSAFVLPGPLMAQDSGAVSVPDVSGPITGGEHGWAFGGHPGGFESLGYVEEEFFVSGTAANYRPLAGFNFDGKWLAEPDETADYTTRVLVQRPEDPADFNGTVLVEWINVSVGSDLLLVPDNEIYEQGYIYVGVSAQKVGVDGYANAEEGAGHGLVQWDNERYGDLVHPGDAFAFDIFSQVGQALLQTDEDTDMLGGVGERMLLATGASQSGATLRTYINVVHPQAGVYDGFLPFVSFGSSTNLFGQTFHPGMTDEERQRFVRYWGIIRDDLDVPVLIVNSETEAVRHRGVTFEYLLQPDTDKFRLWEVAGTPHSARIADDRMLLEDTFIRDFPAGPGAPTQNVAIPTGSRLGYHDVLVSAYHHMSEWMRNGTPAPSQPRLTFIEHDGELMLLRDHFGNAVGGARLPEMDAPIGVNTGIAPGFNRFLGFGEPFSDDLLRQLYPTNEDYVAKVTEAAQNAVEAGVIMQYRADDLIEQARAANIPPSE